MTHAALKDRIDTLRDLREDYGYTPGKFSAERDALDFAIAALSAMEGEAKPAVWMHRGDLDTLKAFPDAVLFAIGRDLGGQHVPLYTAPPPQQAELMALAAKWEADANGAGAYNVTEQEHGRILQSRRCASELRAFATHPTPSPGPQGGGEAEMPGVCAFCEGTGRTESEEGHIFLCPQKCPDEASLLRSFADRVIQAEPWLHKGNRFTKWAKDLAADMKEAADRLATPPAHQPGDVGELVTATMVERAAEVCADKFDLDCYWREMLDSQRDEWRQKARSILSIALAPKEAGHG